MAEPGKINKLRIVKLLDFGAYLDGETLGEVLLPRKWLPAEAKIDDVLEVFLYYDSSDRIIATTMKPKAQLGEFAFLKVTDVNQTGAFLDWGLEKDLLVPYREQKVKMQKGKSYLVTVYIDEKSGRLAASAKVERFLNTQQPAYELHQQVEVLVTGKAEQGYTVIVNNSHQGMLYFSELYSSLTPGKRKTAWVIKVREDGKIDLRLEKPGYEKLDELSEHILLLLKKGNGKLHLSDSSPAEEIHRVLGTSKKNFKKALGALYKKHLIVIEENSIRLL